jgi:AcrR family transcriptional regulator
LAAETIQLPRRRLSRAEQNDAKRRLLLASALEVLTEQGYQAMTLEEVAERAGFTRRPIYTLFGSKEQLALALFEAQIASFTNDMLQAVPPARTLKGTLKRLAEMHTELISGESYQPMYELQTALNGVALRDESIQQTFIEFLGKQHDRFVAWLEKACEATGQEFRAPLDRVASLMEAGMAGLVTMGFLDPSYQGAELKYDLLIAFVAD